MDGSDSREETDSLGTVSVPAGALWGASTERALGNFQISGRRLPEDFIRVYAMLKRAAAKANNTLGLLDDELAAAVADAARAIEDGGHADQFPVDVYQTGSGTSTNMNVNEVIANVANVALGGAAGAKSPVHPNDHVNLGQSSNDTFPSVIHITAARAIDARLLPALAGLQTALGDRANEWAAIIKLGRTHLMDAVPMTMGEAFSGYAAQVGLAIRGVRSATTLLHALPLGGTAVGTGLNTHPDFARLVCADIAGLTSLPFAPADNHFEAQGARDACVEVSGALKALAVRLSKIANDIRWYGSGPRGGIGELSLPALQPGSSIMPGKTNPVICESVIQVCARIVGNDVTITQAGFGGVGSVFELNTAMPLIADTLLESIGLLTNSTVLFTDSVIRGLEVDTERCRERVENSLMLATRLVPAIGYDAAAKIAKDAFATGDSIHAAATRSGLFDDEDLRQLLDTRPSRA